MLVKPASLSTPTKSPTKLPAIAKRRSPSPHFANKSVQNKLTHDKKLSPLRSILLPGKVEIARIKLRRRYRVKVTPKIARIFPSPKSKFVYEKFPKDLPKDDIIRKDGIPTARYDTDLYVPFTKNEEPPKRVPLYPMGWGWNTGGRAGNLTENEIHAPKHVQRSIHENYIACASGYKHSLIVSDDGNVFSFGEGRQGQLGYGNQFAPNQAKGGNVQSTPRAITPSGTYKFGHDLKIVQVACGMNFSLARELSLEEGVDLHRGLRSLERTLSNLKALYPDSETIQRAWAEVRQERFKVSVASQGIVTAWGTGKKGELGLGPYVKFTPSATIIPRIRDMHIVHIAAGKEHCLAINSLGQLFSWGCGKFGRLGHQDFENRYSPELVTFFKQFYVESCAAGAEHSAVLITSAKGSLAREKQVRKISTFGKGYNGRLGNGTNHHSAVPVLVTDWLPSTDGMQIRQVACGGAHTVALLAKAVPRGLANPWGVQTVVVCFGSGRNGQLGNGSAEDCFVPTKARLPKCEVVTQISAGRSWTMAQTIGGIAYTWGRGLRGELGLGVEVKFSLVPKRVESWNSFVRISSGTAHNICIAVPKKHLSESLSIEKAEAVRDATLQSLLLAKKKEKSKMESESAKKAAAIAAAAAAAKRLTGLTSPSTPHLTMKPAASPMAPTVVSGGVLNRSSGKGTSTSALTKSLDPISAAAAATAAAIAKANLAGMAVIANTTPDSDKNFIDSVGVTLKQRNCESTYAFHCCRRHLNPRLSLLRYVCRDCEMSSICHTCAKLCHIGHGLVERKTIQAYVAENVERPKSGRFSHRSSSRKSTSNGDIDSDENEGNSDDSQEDSEYDDDEDEDSDTTSGDISTSRIDTKRQSTARITTSRTITNSSSPTTRHSSSDGRKSKLPPDSQRRRISRTKGRDRNRLMVCRCGLYNSNCRALPVMLEAVDEEVGDFPTARHIAARTIQRVARKYIHRYRERVAAKELQYARRDAANTHYFRCILQPIWTKFFRSAASFREMIEREEMAIEDDLKHKFDYNYNLQTGLESMDALLFGIKVLLGKASAILPRVTVEEGVSNVLRPTFAFSWYSVREQQLKKQPWRRVPPATLALATKYLPRYDPKEGSNSVPDKDVGLLTRRFFRDVPTERIRDRREEKLRAAAVAKAKRAEIALAILMAQKIEKEALFARANALLKGAQPPPPPGPPPREVRMARNEEARAKRLEEERLAVQAEEDAEDANFQLFKVTPLEKIRRRHSINDPVQLYRRITEMRSSIQLHSYSRRRNSLPLLLAPLHPKGRPTPKYVVGIKASLGLIAQRMVLLNGFNDPKYDKMWASVSGNARRRRMLNTLSYSWLNPRMPPEMLGLLADSTRRRTIAEPERLARQLNIMLEVRSGFALLRKRARRAEKMIVRRRSFDLGEEKDAVGQISSRLGFEFEEPLKLPTVRELKKDATMMDTKILLAGIDINQNFNHLDAMELIKPTKQNPGNLTAKTGKAARSAYSQQMRETLLSMGVGGNLDGSMTARGGMTTARGDLTSRTARTARRGPNTARKGADESESDTSETGRGGESKAAAAASGANGGENTFRGNMKSARTPTGRHASVVSARGAFGSLSSVRRESKSALLERAFSSRNVGLQSARATARIGVVNTARSGMGTSRSAMNTARGTARSGLSSARSEASRGAADDSQGTKEEKNNRRLVRKAKPTADATVDTADPNATIAESAPSMNGKNLEANEGFVDIKSLNTSSIAEIWQEHYSEQGQTYYYNPNTGQSSWELPRGSNVQLLNQFQDPTSGNWYWYNTVTGESSWV